MQPLKILPALLLSAALAACSTPSQRIERALINYGLPAPQAECMGFRLAQRLTNNQLRQLDQLARLNSDRLGRTRLEDIGRTLAGAENPALIAEVVRTGLGCLI